MKSVISLCLFFSALASASPLTGDDLLQGKWYSIKNRTFTIRFNPIQPGILLMVFDADLKSPYQKPSTYKVQYEEELKGYLFKGNKAYCPTLYHIDQNNRDLLYAEIDPKRERTDCNSKAGIIIEYKRSSPTPINREITEPLSESTDTINKISSELSAK